MFGKYNGDSKSNCQHAHVTRTYRIETKQRIVLWITCGLNFKARELEEKNQKQCTMVSTVQASGGSVVFGQVWAQPHYTAI